MDTIICPLCGQKNVEYKAMRTYGIPLGKDFDFTHVWVCPECPFVGFEFWAPQNAETVFYNLR